MGSWGGLAILVSAWMLVLGIEPGGRMAAYADPEPPVVATGAASFRWEQRTDTRLLPMAPLVFKHGLGVLSVAVAPDGARALTAAEDGAARLWDLFTGESLLDFRHQDVVSAVSFSSDGSKVLTGSWDHTAKLWDAETGEKLGEFQHPSAVRTAALSADASKVVTGTADGTAHLWDVATGKVIRTFEHSGNFTAVAISPDGDRILTATNSDNHARVWSVTSGDLVMSLRHNSIVKSAAFSPDGNSALTGSDDSRTYLWDLAKRRAIHYFPHESRVWSVAFSPDGSRILTGSADKTATIWSFDRQLRTFRHDERVWSVAFAPDGEHVLTGANDGRARYWDIRSEPTAEILRSVQAEALKSCLRQLRSLPPSLTSARERLRAETPRKDEFESKARFRARFAAHAQKVQELNLRIKRYLDAAPTKLTPLQLAAVARTSLRRVFGDPVLANVRYDAETENFLMELGPTGAHELGLPRHVALRMPPEQARLNRDRLVASRPRIEFEISPTGELKYRRASVKLEGKTYTLVPREGASE